MNLVVQASARRILNSTEWDQAYPRFEGFCVRLRLSLVPRSELGRPPRNSKLAELALNPLDFPQLDLKNAPRNPLNHWEFGRLIFVSLVSICVCLCVYCVMGGGLLRGQPIASRTADLRTLQPVFFKDLPHIQKKVQNWIFPTFKIPVQKKHCSQRVCCSAVA